MPQTQKEDITTDIPRTLMLTMPSVPWVEAELDHDDSEQVRFLNFGNAPVAAEWFYQQMETHMKKTGFIPNIIKDHINRILPTINWETGINRLENFISERIFEIPKVEFVFFSIEKDSIEIWTVINELDRAVRKKIYNVEYSILELFREFAFDFHVLCRYDRDINEIRPSNAKIISQK